MNRSRSIRIALAATTTIATVFSFTTGAGASGPDVGISQNGAVAGNPELNDRFGSSLAIGDFDGDGFDDAAVGVPGEAIGNLAGAGAVNILYGSPDGLGTADNTFFSQNTAGVNGTSETGDQFGSSLVSGDFDGDGRDDLAIGVPGEAISSVQSAGMVNVLFGSPSGLWASGDQSLHQGTIGISGTPEPFDRFGWSLGAGDVDGDGRDDLLIGVPYENIRAITDAGLVSFVPGGPSGLVLTDEYSFYQDSSGAAMAAETGDRFGWSIAVGDLDGSGGAEVAVSSPWEAVDGGEGVRSPNAGIVTVYRDSPFGPDVSDVGINNGIDVLSSPDNRRFGRDLALRRTAAACTCDLIVGVRDSIQGAGGGVEIYSYDADLDWNLDDTDLGRAPSEEPGTAVAGQLNEFASSETGGYLHSIVRADDEDVAVGIIDDNWSFDGDWGQSDAPGTPEQGDEFGTDIALGDFDADGLDDLLVGIPGEDVGQITDAGAIVVAYGVNQDWVLG